MNDDDWVVQAAEEELRAWMMSRGPAAQERPRHLLMEEWELVLAREGAPDQCGGRPWKWVPTPGKLLRDIGSE